MSAPESLCEECDDAPAVVGAWFNGRVWTRLCQECFDWWENHGLAEPKELFPGANEHQAHLDGTAKVPNLDKIAGLRPAERCDHNELVVYNRPWRRLFRKTFVYICIRCDRERPYFTSITQQEKEQQ